VQDSGCWMQGKGQGRALALPSTLVRQQQRQDEQGGCGQPAVGGVLGGRCRPAAGAFRGALRREWVPVSRLAGVGRQCGLPWRWPVRLLFGDMPACLLVYPCVRVSVCPAGTTGARFRQLARRRQLSLI
jgi:hypothetical protein